jgi:hypothetical protein
MPHTCAAQTAHSRGGHEPAVLLARDLPRLQTAPDDARRARTQAAIVTLRAQLCDEQAAHRLPISRLDVLCR